MLELQPINFADACLYIRQHHRHLPPPVSWKFGAGCRIVGQDGLSGVICVGRPVARYLDNGWTVEVNRCATDGTRNAASLLYGAAWRAARALGYRRLVTYTLPSEGGASLRGAGYRVVGQTQSQPGWGRPSRPRDDSRYPVGQKTLWERHA